jgi:RNA polymerase sigma-70 factor (ECF subfamily)
MNNRRAVRPKHPDTTEPEDLTALLAAWNEGNIEARDRLMPLVYDELRRRAAAFLRRERSGHTLQPTALVHEVYLRLVDQERAIWRNRAQFLAIASEMMRRILVDRARARKMAKRSGGLTRITLAEDAARGAPRDVDVLDLDRVLGETGQVLGTSLATTMRDWQAARAWLFRRLTRVPAAPDGGS